MKLTKKHLADGFNKAKNFIGSAYHNTKKFLGDVDHGVQMFKKAYSIAAPLLDHYAGSNNGLHNNIMKGLTGYDNIRSQAMEHHDRIGENLNTLKNTLVKKSLKYNP